MCVLVKPVSQVDFILFGTIYDSNESLQILSRSSQTTSQVITNISK